MKAFNARLISKGYARPLYRVFLGPGEAFLIQIEASNMGHAFAIHFGLLGMLIYAMTRKHSRKKLEAKIKEVELQHPSAQLAASKHNFHLSVSEIEISTLEAPSIFAGYGQHFGRWVSKLRGQKQMVLQLESLEDMKQAFEELPCFSAQHANQVVWDASKNRFKKLPA